MPDSVATSDSPLSAVMSSGTNLNVPRFVGASIQLTIFSPFASVRPWRSSVTVAFSANVTVRAPSASPVPFHPVDVVSHVAVFSERSIVEPGCISQPWKYSRPSVSTASGLNVP